MLSCEHTCEGTPLSGRGWRAGDTAFGKAGVIGVASAAELPVGRKQNIEYCQALRGLCVHVTGACMCQVTLSQVHASLVSHACHGMS